MEGSGGSGRRQHHPEPSNPNAKRKAALLVEHTIVFGQAGTPEASLSAMPYPKLRPASGQSAAWVAATHRRCLPRRSRCCLRTAARATRVCRSTLTPTLAPALSLALTLALTLTLTLTLTRSAEEPRRGDGGGGARGGHPPRRRHRRRQHGHAAEGQLVTCWAHRQGRARRRAGNGLLWLYLLWMY